MLFRKKFDDHVCRKRSPHEICIFRTRRFYAIGLLAMIMLSDPLPSYSRMGHGIRGRSHHRGGVWLVFVAGVKRICPIDAGKIITAPKTWKELRRSFNIQKPKIAANGDSSKNNMLAEASDKTFASEFANKKQ